MEQLNSQTLLDFINQHGVTISAAASLILFLMQVALDNGRMEKRSLGAAVRSFVLICAAVLTMGYAIYGLYNNFEQKTQTTRAVDAIGKYYDRCSARIASLSPARQRQLVGERASRVRADDAEWVTTYLLRYDCLSLAMRAYNSSGGRHMVAEGLAHDTSLGARLLGRGSVAGEDASEGTIADTLKAMMGIDREEFTGLGRSLPIVDTQSDRMRYTEALLSEYWAPNVCAETVNTDICPQRWPRAWAWRFTNLGDVRGMTLRQLILEMEPAAGSGTLQLEAMRDRLRTGSLRDPTTLLVRFQIFPQRYYAGTVGRPEAQRVFFSSLAESAELEVQQAFLLSGMSDPNEQSTDDDSTAFIWVYEPQTRREYTRASWSDLFVYLSRRNVEAPVAAIGNARNWPQQ
jgi:hypothetical protein